MWRASSIAPLAIPDADKPEPARDRKNLRRYRVPHEEFTSGPEVKLGTSHRNSLSLSSVNVLSRLREKPTGETSLLVNTLIFVRPAPLWEHSRRRLTNGSLSRGEAQRGKATRQLSAPRRKLNCLLAELLPVKVESLLITRGKGKRRRRSKARARTRMYSPVRSWTKSVLASAWSRIIGASSEPSQEKTPSVKMFLA